MSGNKNPMGQLLVLSFTSLFVAFFLIVVYLLFIGPYAGLPENVVVSSKNATQTIAVNTQSAEVSKIAGLTLTVEGILLGFIGFGRSRRT